MANLTCSIRIEAPQARVFEVISDLERAPERIDAILKVEVLTDGPMGVGTRWRETRMMFKKECTEEMEVVAFDPPNSYTVTAESCGSLYETSFVVKPDGAASIVEMTFKATPQTFMAKVMSPMGTLMIGMMKKMVDQDLRDLKRHIEGGGEAPAATAQPA